MGKSTKKYTSNREVKDSAFTAYFKEPKNACQLYAALGEEEVSPEDITYVTLEGVLFIPASNEPSAVLARAFGECREGQIPRSSAAHQA